MLKASEAIDRLLRKPDEVIGPVSLKGRAPSAMLTRLKGVAAAAAAAAGATECCTFYAVGINF